MKYRKVPDDDDDMNDAIYRCELPIGHQGMHENGTNVWIGFARHTAEPISTIQHIQYSPAHNANEEKNGKEVQ